MSGGERSRAVLVGVAAGLAGGLFGVGGGLVMIPLLTGALRLSQHKAHGTSLAVIGATALASVAVYGMHGNVAWRTAGIVGVASTITARYGARMAARTSTRALKGAFAALLLAVALRLLWKVPSGSGASLHGAGPALAFELALGGAIGLLAGFMGVGGGILAVPAFSLVLGMPQQLAQGTSLGVILIAAPAGAIEHHRNGNVALRLVGWLSLGAAAGGPAASWLAQKLPHDMLVRAFSVFLLMNALFFWLRTDAGKRASEGRADPDDPPWGPASPPKGADEVG